MSSSIHDVAFLLCEISGRTQSTETHPMISGLRRPTFSEVQKDLPGHYWVQDIVRPNGRKDKKYFSPEGKSFRSMCSANQHLTSL
jgi:hypothetical protein